jgi:hypothetical protein
LWNVESEFESGCIFWKEAEQTMKVSSRVKDFRRGRNFRRETGRFPVIECNFQTFSLDRFYGGSSSSPASSFLNISRDYFRYEARRNFLAEVAFFIAIIAILAITFVTGALAIIHFLQLPAA